MRKSKFRARVRAGEPVRLAVLGHFIPAFVRHAAHFGYDAIWVDCEHRNMDPREIQSLLAHFHLFDIDCLLRVTTREKASLYRYLEDGAAGLMIPHVTTADEARHLVNAVKFPPLGDRGFDGAGLDSDYLLDGNNRLDEYNDETYLVVQIESPQAVENADAIAAVDGVDAMFVGTGDLGLRLQRTETDLTLEQCLARVAAAAEKHGKTWGAPAGSQQHIGQLHDLGARLIAYGGEFRAMMEALRTAANELEDVYRGRS